MFWSLSLISFCIIIYAFIEAKKSWQEGRKLEGLAIYAFIPFYPILLILIYLKS